MDQQGSGSPGSWARPRSAGRTPAQGFPPGRLPQRQAPPEDLFGSLGGGPHPGDMDPGDAAAGDAAAGDAAVTAAMPAVAPRRGSRPGGGKTSRSRTALIAVVVLVAMAAGGFAGYKFLYQSRANAPVSGTLRLPTNAPGSAGSPGFDKALGKWQHIGTRAQDPAPLTIQELYPAQFALDGSSYVRTAASVTKSCSLAVYGADLQAALQAGHCSQLLRASYVSGNNRMMGTIGVANLTSASAAQKAGQATGPQEIIAPLTARSGPAKKLGTGTGIVQAKIKGHYLILMWAEFASLKSPSTAAARQQLEQFAANLLTGSANISLSSRMLGTRT
jgi:hypothetical protein